jgi:hypothetical protein
MGPNRVFFPQAALDRWLEQSNVELSGAELRLLGEQRRYKIAPALRVLSEVSGGPDVYDLVGRVKTMNFVAELGAEVLDTSMLIGDSAYDVVPGFVGAPVAERSEARALPKTEEDLLAQYLMSKLE